MILRKEIDSYNLHIEEIKKYANEHDLLKGKYFARYYINEGEIYNNVINGETIKFYEFSLRDYSFNFKTFLASLYESVQLHSNISPTILKFKPVKGGRASSVEAANAV